jgi:catechol 2,3-dioxygenase
MSAPVLDDPVLSVSVSRLGHIGIAVRDLDRTVEFYRRMLGLRLTESFDYGDNQVGHGVGVSAGAFVRCDTNHHCISFFALRNVDDATSGPAYGLHHVAFELNTPEELVSLYRRFRSEGIPIVNARKGGPGNQPRFYARDPDGNLLEFYWGLDQIGWQGVPRAYEPIEEIDLETFDFTAYVQQRQHDAAAVSA